MTEDEIDMLRRMMKRLSIVDNSHATSGIHRVKIEGYLYPQEIALMDKMFNDAEVQP